MSVFCIAGNLEALVWGCDATQKKLLIIQIISPNKTQHFWWERNCSLLSLCPYLGVLWKYYVLQMKSTFDHVFMWKWISSCWRLVPSILGWESMGKMDYSGIKLSSMGKNPIWTDYHCTEFNHDQWLKISPFILIFSSSEISPMKIPCQCVNTTCIKSWPINLLVQSAQSVTANIENFIYLLRLFCFILCHHFAICGNMSQEYSFLSFNFLVCGKKSLTYMYCSIVK